MTKFNRGSSKEGSESHRTNSVMSVNNKIYLSFAKDTHYKLLIIPDQVRL